MAIYLAGLFLCPLVGLYIAFIRVNHAAGGGAGIAENIRRKNHGGAGYEKRGARASVFLKIFTGGGTRHGQRGANCAAHDTRAAGVGTRAAGRRRVPSHIGSKTVENGQKSENRATRRRALLAQARAMFFSNNHVKNDMNVSRETLPIFCAIRGGLLTD